MSQPVDTSRLGAQAGREHVAKRESAPSHDTRRVTLTTYMKEMSPYLGNANTASPLRPKTWPKNNLDLSSSTELTS